MRAAENGGGRKVAVRLLADQRGLYIQTIVGAGGHTAESVISGLHDNIVSLEAGRPGGPNSALRTAGGPARASAGWPIWRHGSRALYWSDCWNWWMTWTRKTWRFWKTGSGSTCVWPDMVSSTGGHGVGRTLERLVRQGMMQRDMVLAARILASAAADARMAGVKMPAMSSAGSGNHGLTAILPIVAVTEFVGRPARDAGSGGLSHVITGYIKAYTGRLSAVCGCSVAAGAGAAAGIAYLLAGDRRQIAGAIKNLIMGLAGVICDGAKAGCALKLSTAAGTAVQAALFSLQGVKVSATDGIAGSPPRTP